VPVSFVVGQHRNWWVKFWAGQRNWFPGASGPLLPDLGVWSCTPVLSQYTKTRISAQKLPEAQICSFLQLKQWVWTSVPDTERPLYTEWRQLWRETGVEEVQLCNFSAPSPSEPQKRTMNFPLLPEDWDRKMPLKNSGACFSGGLLHSM